MPRDTQDDPLAELAQAALAGGNPACARAFLTAVAPRVLRVVRQVMGATHPDLEDILQEALIGILDGLPRFRGESSVAHYVRRVALLTALNARRRHQLHELLAPQIGWEETQTSVDSGSSPAEEVDARRRLHSFEVLLDELPAPQAEVIALHCVLGHTVAETAEICQTPVNTVRSRLASAKAALRKRLEEDVDLEAHLRGVS